MRGVLSTMLVRDSMWCGRPRKTESGGRAFYDGGWKPNQDAPRVRTPRRDDSHDRHCHDVTPATITFEGGPDDSRTA